MENEILKLFGLELETLLMISGIVYILVEAFKKKFAAIFMGGWKTDALAFMLSFGMSFKVYPGKWQAIIASAILCWLGPAVLHKKTKGD
ncbi:MAG: hypothetical protein PVJ60_00830 [Phycisphaerales bacterium]|jgi:hypothetical protein